MPKFQRQTTYANESDILKTIDDRFEELEETVALAALVPQLHDRLYQVEQLLRRVPTGPQWGDEAPPVQRPPPDDDGKEVAVQVKELPVGLSPEELAEYSPKSTRSRKSKRITDMSREKMSDITEQLLDTQTGEYYTFGESTWDLVLFIGTGALGPLGSLQTCLLAMNVLMQVVFVAIAFFNFTVPDVDPNTVTDVQRWRRSSGHSIWSYDETSRESMVKRVCDLDKSLEQSGVQMALYENIDKYLKLGREGLEGWFTGQLLCLMALVCWYLMVAKEVSHATALHRGIMAAPTAPTRLDTRENPFTQARHYRLRSVARKRKLFSLALLCYRLLAAALLVFVGTFFLVYTVSVTELILNAVALGIILDIDDLLFDALATTPGRHLVHQLDPLPMPSLPRLRGADAKSACMSFLIPTFTIFVYLTMLGPFVGTLTDVSVTMCGGNMDFVWQLDRRQVVLMAPTVGGGWADDEGSVKSKAVEEGEKIGHGIQQSDARFAVWMSDTTVLGDLALLSLPDIIDVSNPSCGDLADQDPAMLAYLRHWLANESITSCAQVEGSCDSLTSMPDYGLDGGVGWTTRMLCSETCGCQSPAGSHINVQGCPYGLDRPCHTQVLTARSEALCADRNLSQLRADAGWSGWVTTLRQYGESVHDVALKQEALMVAQAMWDHGCGFMQNLSAQNVSWGSCFAWNSSFEFNFKTVDVFCPISCDCSVDNKDLSLGCPRPFGYECDQLEREGCLTYQEQHFCPGFSTSVQGECVVQLIFTDPSSGGSYAFIVQQLLFQSISFFAGVDIETVVFNLVPRGSLFEVRFNIFQVDDSMDMAAISSWLFATEVSAIQSHVLNGMTQAGVPPNVFDLTVIALVRQSGLP